MRMRGGPPAVLAAAAIATFQATTFKREKENQRYLQLKIDKASRLIETYMVTHGIPGLSVGLTIDGHQVWSNGFGFANIETATPCPSDAVMRIASISKPLTATIAAKLVQDGKLDLDKSIQEYITEFPTKVYEGKPVIITTRQLLSHTGGIRHYEKKDEKEPSTEFLSNVNFSSVSAALNMFKEDELVASPGSKFSYTTHGLTLASAVLEQASGKQFPQLIKELCTRMGLSNTALDLNRTIIPNRVSYYVRVDGVLQNCQEVDNSYKWAGGGLLSTTADLLRFSNALLSSYQSSSNSGYLSRDVLNTFWSGEISINENSKSALGWMRMESPRNGMGDKSSTVIYHTGGAVGASSVLMIRPEISVNTDTVPRGSCIVMLCNLQSVSLFSLAKQVEAIFTED